jgi:hypothetical protein
MRCTKLIRLPPLLLFAAALCLVSPLPSHAQTTIPLGPAPVCPYGYYDYAPYNCAPYGYYGAEWFPHGIFIGAGPWFHGPRNFRGQVDSKYDPRHGYDRDLPHRGERARHHLSYDFQANATSDGRGHDTNEASYSNDRR